MLLLLLLFAYLNTHNLGAWPTLGQKNKQENQAKKFIWRQSQGKILTLVEVGLALPFHDAKSALKRVQVNKYSSHHNL